MKTRSYFSRLILISAAICCMLPVFAQNNSVWATATSGGTYGYGTILRGNGDGTDFHSVYSFDDIIGRYPIGKMAMADNGKLYITCELGGYGDSCTICSYDTATGICTKIYDFDSLPQYGYVPQSGMVKAGNGKLYGIVSNGGANQFGVIYMIDPANDKYTDIYDFQGPNTSAPNTEPLIAQDGLLYGLTAPFVGGYGGELFRFDPFTNTYSVLHNLPMNFGPYGYGPLMQAADGKLYGVVNNGLDSGIIFSYDLGTNALNLLYHLDINSQGSPQGGLVQAGNGKLYGVTSQHNGQVYSYDIATGVYSRLQYLDSATGFYAAHNMGKLSNGKLVFSTTDGGPSQLGALVSYDIATNTLAVMLNCDDATGTMPQCDLYEDNTARTNTGISATTLSAFGLYPNPANDRLYISEAPFNTEYTVTNMLGESLIKGTITQGIQTVDISGLPAGMYLYQ